MKVAYVVNGTEVVRPADDLVTAKGPVRSNNIAEYLALILLLQHLENREREEGPRARYVVCGDSQVVIRQMQGEYRVTKSHLKALHSEAAKLAARLDVEFQWVPRDENAAGRLLEARSARDREATREN